MPGRRRYKGGQRSCLSVTFVFFAGEKAGFVSDKTSLYRLVSDKTTSRLSSAMIWFEFSRVRETEKRMGRRERRRIPELKRVKNGFHPLKPGTEAISQIPAAAFERRKMQWMAEQERPIFGPATSLLVGRSPTPGDAPSSRLVSSPNLWPRHPRLFGRCLLTRINFFLREMMAGIRREVKIDKRVENGFHPLKPA